MIISKDHETTMKDLNINENSEEYRLETKIGPLNLENRLVCNFEKLFVFESSLRPRVYF
jgi:hypothetical protein